MKVFLKKVRLSFPHLHEPNSYEGGPAKFSASYIFPADHPAVKEVNAAIVKVAQEKWGAKADAILKQLKTAGKTCLRDGDTKADRDEYAGNMFISASSAKRVKLVDTDGTTPLVEADGKPYGGCYVNAFVEIWAMDNQFGKRICAGLGGVQFHSDGEPFGASSGNDEFSAVEDTDESFV